MKSPLNQRAGQSLCLCGRGGIGRHARLKILFLYRSAGSIPAARTKIVEINFVASQSQLHMTLFAAL